MFEETFLDGKTDYPGPVGLIDRERWRRTTGGPAVTVAIVVGVGLVTAGWWSSGDWESVAIDTGVTLALAVVLVVLEQKWENRLATATAAVNTRLDSVEAGLAEVREAAATTIDERFTAAGESRALRDRALVDAWKQDPSPATLWAVVLRCRSLGVSEPRQWTNNKAVIHFAPQSETEVQMMVVAASGSTRHGRFTWLAGEGLDEFADRVLDGLARNRVMPPNFSLQQVIDEIGNQYLADFDSAYKPTS